MSESKATNWLYLNGHLGYSLKLQALTELLETNAAEARAEQSNRVKRHLERVDERECSLDAWNCICDALGELE